MERANSLSLEARRDRTGGIVRDKLDILMAEMLREEVPAHLIKLAEDLQTALNEKGASADASA
jgi:hypothetical protein